MKTISEEVVEEVVDEEEVVEQVVDRGELVEEVVARGKVVEEVEDGESEWKRLWPGER